MDMSKEWLVGFIEGEGNFHVQLSKACSFVGKRGLEYYPIPQFRIMLTEEDGPLLIKIKNFIGLGEIYRKNNQYVRDKGINAKDELYWVISSVSELIKFENPLTEIEFHSKKRKDKEIFFDIVRMKHKKEHLTKRGHDAIVEMANLMNSGNRDLFRANRLTE
jgi:hypothetical protein